MNNALSVIIGNAQLLQMESVEGQHDSESVNEILWAAERSVVLVRDLLADPHSGVQQPVQADLDEPIRTQGSDPEPSAREGLKALVSPGSALKHTAADSNQNHPTPKELTGSAAIRGGTVPVAISDGDVRPVTSHRSPHPVPLENLRVIAPTFTDKEVGSLSGGAIARDTREEKVSSLPRALEQNGGSTDVFRKGVGEKRTSRVDPSRTKGAVVAGKSERCLIPSPTATALVIGDELPLRNAIRTSLDGGALTIIEAAGAEEALGIARWYPRKIDIVLIDDSLPLPHKGELIQRLSEYAHDLKVILLTDEVKGPTSPHGSDILGIHLVKTPFSPTTLPQLIGTVLDFSAESR